ncbi:MATE family efflux transporter [Bacterioplanoides sp.]|uniref:MATE family efflux transporter n=1 Tax=Bacterioplanoides sp. TaxID=2066072 RepID=UPI003B59D706
MNHTNDMKTAPINRLFIRFLIPALIAVVIKSVTIVVDTIFIGQGVGPLGLASAGLLMPFFAFFSSFAVMVGLGGSALASIKFGQNDVKGAQALFSQSLFLAIIVVAPLCLLGWMYTEDIVILLGAEGKLAEIAGDYLVHLFPFYFFHTLVLVLIFFVVNDNNPRLPMIAIFAASVVNILLDYIFIFVLDMGIRGAAFASMFAQLTALAVLAIHFVTIQGKLKLNVQFYNVKDLLHILFSGSPVFLLELGASVAMMVFNYVLLNQYSDNHLAAYGVSMNIAMVLLFLFGAIGQACQPIISFSHGAGNQQRSWQTLKLGFYTSAFIGLFAILFLQLTHQWIIPLYTDGNSEVDILASQAILWYFWAAPLLGINLMAASYYQAIEQPVTSTLIGLSRSLVFYLAALFVLPLWWPEQGIWMLTLFAETLTILLVAIIFRRLQVAPRFIAK